MFGRNLTERAIINAEYWRDECKKLDKQLANKEQHLQTVERMLLESDARVKELMGEVNLWKDQVDKLVWEKAKYES